MAKVADKRLGIELASLRQSLWRSREGGRRDPRVADTRPHDATDVVRWIDTKVMLCDCMTKDMDGAMLMRAIKENEHDIAQPSESFEIKRRKQLQRRRLQNPIVDLEEAELDG